MSNEIFQCRICFEEEDDLSLFVSPCRCSGTSKYVHVECLQEWIRTTENSDAKKKCMECKTAYKYTTNHLAENITLYVNTRKNIWKTYITNVFYIFPFSLILTSIDEYAIKSNKFMVLLYQPGPRVLNLINLNDMYSIFFYTANSTFFFNTKFLLTYLYLVNKNIHRRKQYIKSMFFHICLPLFCVLFFYIINRIIMSYDDVDNLMSFNTMYIIVSQVTNYQLLKLHDDTIKNMNLNLEINILSYVNNIDIDIESKNLELSEV